MTNIKESVSPDGKTLTLVIDLTKKGFISKSGKSEIVAGTSGFVPVPGKNLTDIRYALNVIK